MSANDPHPLEDLLRRRIAIIDGAMGTTIRTYGMTEAHIRGERFKDSTKDLLNNGDLFSLTQPDMICDIHRRFLEAGADIISVSTGQTMPQARPAYGRLFQTPYAEQIRLEASVPTIAVGMIGLSSTLTCVSASARW